MRRVLSIILSCLLVLSLAACAQAPTDGEATTAISTSNSETSVETTQGTAKLNIAVLLNDTKDFQALVKAGYETWAKNNAEIADVTIYDAELDVNKQVSQCETAISNGANAVVAVVVDSNTSEPITEMCREAGVPLICAQIPALSGYDVWVGSDHAVSGQMEAEYIVKKLNGKGNVGIIYGALANDAATKRWEGAKKVLMQYPDIKIVGEQTGNWSRAEGIKVMENWLQSDIGPTLNAVIGGNDEMAIGAVLAAIDAGRTDIIFGIICTRLQERKLAYDMQQMTGLVRLWPR